MYVALSSGKVPGTPSQYPYVMVLFVRMWVYNKLILKLLGLGYEKEQLPANLPTGHVTIIRFKHGQTVY